MPTSKALAWNSLLNSALKNCPNQYKAHPVVACSEVAIDEAMVQLPGTVAVQADPDHQTSELHQLCMSHLPYVVGFMCSTQVGIADRKRDRRGPKPPTI